MVVLGTAADQYGMKVPVYKSIVDPDNSSKKVISQSYCMPKCGSSGTYTSSGDFCISKGSTGIGNMVPGYTWCPDDSGDSNAVEGNLLHSNPAGPLGNPLNNECLSSCPPGQIVNNVSPQRECISLCESDGRYIDAGSKCLKVPYNRTTQDGDVTDTDGQVLTLEQSVGSTANSVAKISLSGGSQSVVQGVTYAAVACGLVVVILLVMKYQGAKYQK
jgi:hypothetical protein